MSTETQKVEPWNVYAPASREQLLEAAESWRKEASRGGTVQFQSACLATAREMEDKASDLARLEASHG